MRKYLILVLLPILLVQIVGCNETKKKADGSQDHNATISLGKPDFSQTDSIEVYYFPNAKNQKVFIRNLITDTSSVNRFVTFLNNPEAGTMRCDNDYKLFFYRNGDIYKTVYAATTDSCNYLAYVISGVSYFMPLTDSVNIFLANRKQ